MNKKETLHGVENHDSISHPLKNVKRQWLSKYIWRCISSLSIAIIGLIWYVGFYSEVDNSIKNEDLTVINKILSEYKITPKFYGSCTYEEQITFIRSIQLAVLDIAPENEGIPEGRRRGPYILYTLKHGLCYDRSRTIEKILRVHKFKTRHIFIFPSIKGKIVPTIFNNELFSHAITEVETSKGWLVVDSNYPWISVTINGNPVGIKDVYSIYNSNKDHEFLYNEFNKENIYKNEFGYIYGLYSRHGKFYPPYNFIPDINWKEFVQNL